MRVWYRSKSGIRKMRSTDVPPETPATNSAPAIVIPLDVAEMITSHLIYDRRSLLVCSMICRSWYMAAVPHLHHTLTSRRRFYPFYREDGKRWPEPLIHMHKLGLLPFVKKLHIYCDGSYFDVERIFPRTSYRTLRHPYSTMINLQELAIDDLRVDMLMPKLRRCFGYFSPTLRSLALREPRGSCRQIIYFIGFFQQLEDLKLILSSDTSTRHLQEGPNDYLTPSPRFIPPLRGRLTMAYYEEVELLKLMINVFGGLRFHSMDLFAVDGTQLLLDACAETLETLRFFHYREQLPPKGIQLYPTTTKFSTGTLICPGTGPFGSSRFRHYTLPLTNHYISCTRF